MSRTRVVAAAAEPAPASAAERSFAWYMTLLLLIPLVALALCAHAPDPSSGGAFQMDPRSGVLQRVVANASNHLYPYVAAVFTCGCIVVVILGIIMFGGSL